VGNEYRDPRRTAFSLAFRVVHGHARASFAQCAATHSPDASVVRRPAKARNIRHFASGQHNLEASCSMGTSTNRLCGGASPTPARPPAQQRQMVNVEGLP